MTTMDDILWLVAARAGSKGIPNKNIRKLGSYPLLAYRIKAAQHASVCGKIWCSDSQQYALIAKEYGAEVPFIRPAHLAGDNASSVDVALHAMEIAENQGLKFKYIGLLEPTSPFVHASNLLQAVETLEMHPEDDGIIAVKEVMPHRSLMQDDGPYLSDISRNIREMALVGRQHFPRQITPSGGFYIVRWDRFLLNKSFYSEKTRGYLLEPSQGLEIDEISDWILAEYYLEKKIIQIEKIIGNER